MSNVISDKETLNKKKFKRIRLFNDIKLILFAICFIPTLFFLINYADKYHLKQIENAKKIGEYKEKEGVFSVVAIEHLSSGDSNYKVTFRKEKKNEVVVVIKNKDCINEKIIRGGTFTIGYYEIKEKNKSKIFIPQDCSSIKKLN